MGVEYGGHGQWNRAFKKFMNLLYPFNRLTKRWSCPYSRCPKDRKNMLANSHLKTITCMTSVSSRTQKKMCQQRFFSRLKSFSVKWFENFPSSLSAHLFINALLTLKSYFLWGLNFSNQLLNSLGVFPKIIINKLIRQYHNIWFPVPAALKIINICLQISIL